MLILPPTLILSPLFCFSKKRLFEEIADYASCELKVEPRYLIDELNSREKMGTTVFFKGIALPHAIINDIDNSYGVLSILDKPITFNSIDADEQLVDLAYTLFVSPQENYQHIEILLQQLTQILANNDLLNALRLCRGEKSKISDILNKIDLTLNQSIKVKN